MEAGGHNSQLKKSFNMVKIKQEIQIISYFTVVRGGFRNMIKN